MRASVDVDALAQFLTSLNIGLNSRGIVKPGETELLEKLFR